MVWSCPCLSIHLQYTRDTREEQPSSIATADLAFLLSPVLPAFSFQAFSTCVLHGHTGLVQLF